MINVLRFLREGVPHTGTPSLAHRLTRAGWVFGRTEKDANILAVCGEQEPVRISALPHTHAQAEHSLLATQAKLTASRAGL